MSKSNGLYMLEIGKSLRAKDLKTAHQTHWRQGLITALGLTLVSSAWAQQEAQAAAPAASTALSSTSAASSAAEQNRSTPIAPIALAPAAPLTGPARLLPIPNWHALSPAQRQILAPLEADWNELDASHRSKWLEVATRFASLTHEDQARLQERMRDWARLSPAQRQEARIGFQVAKKMDAEARQAKWEAYQALPAEQRQQLAVKAAQKQELQANKLMNSAGSKGPVTATQAKSNLVPAVSPGLVPKPVAASLLQAKPGATTVLMTNSRFLTAHQQAGETKILAHPEMVDSKTLLPKKRNIDTKPTS